MPQRVIVTGGSRGIGRAVVEAFAARGAEIVFGFNTAGTGAAEVVETVRSLGGRARAVQADLTRPAQASAFVEAAVAELGAVDVLVHCAVAAARGSLLEVEDASLATAVDANGVVFLRLVRALAPCLAGPGSIVFLTSQGGRDVVPDYGLVGPPKALAESFARYLAVELGPRAIRVNIVEAGPIDTPSFRAVTAPGMGVEAFMRGVAARTPLKRIVTPQDVAGVVLDLCGEQFAMVTGQRVVVDGGLTLLA